MSWTNLHPIMRRAILREAVRRGMAIDIFFTAIGGAV
jgi:hypothetical protein